MPENSKKSRKLAKMGGEPKYLKKNQNFGKEPKYRKWPKTAKILEK